MLMLTFIMSTNKQTGGPRWNIVKSNKVTKGLSKNIYVLKIKFQQKKINKQ